MGKYPKQECLTLYPEIADIAKNLSDKQLGTLIRALINYRFEGIVTDFPRTLSSSIFERALPIATDSL